MRLWWTLGLVTLGAVFLSQLPLANSTGTETSDRFPSGRELLGFARPTVGKTERALVSAQAEQLIEQGLAEDRQGRPATALRHFQAAVQLARQSGAELSEARALVNSGDVSANLGDLDAAFSSYEQAREKWSHGGFNADRLRTLQALARLYLQIVEPARAIDFLREADKIDPNRAANLHLLGMAFYEGGRAGFALGLLRRALDQARVERDPELEARVLADTASVAASLNNIELAAVSLDASLLISQERKIPTIEAYARAGRGTVLGLQGRFDEALAEFDRAASMFRSLGEPESLAIVLARKASLERRRGNLAAALEVSRQAMDLIEAQRLEITSPRARAAWLAASSDPYEIQIDVLWQLARRERGSGSEALAFEVSEQIRARTLYEALAAGGTSRRPDTADLQRQRREVTLALRKLEGEKLHLFPPEGEGARARLAQIQAEIRTLLGRESELWEKLRRSDPRSALAGLQPLKLPQVQSLLDPDTALLAYTLGEERSFAWWIEQDSLTMVEIPGRKKIEETAGEVQKLLARDGLARRSKERQLDALLAQLSDLVLAPLADRLSRVHHLAIVPDGALQTIPFAALPQPRTASQTGEALIANHALVFLPSPSTLAALRQRAEEREEKPDKLIAVIAYPVTSPNDPRIAHPAVQIPEPVELGRLPQTEKEAKTILSFVPKGMGRLILGFEAVPEVIKDPDLRRYRYIHFGAHSLVDPRNPELSGIVLSGFTPDGGRRNGRLSFYEIYDLDLPVDLVSLSTCRSADGPQIRREGPITMTRSFLYAGASRVLGTLWNVGDKAAQELTSAFYEGILRKGKTPAESLRDAQDAMRRNNWSRRDWGAFVLQGDWR
jgi:CHAT domain-containing protein/tetratricopeptide (TPR) repeat protein